MKRPRRRPVRSIEPVGVLEKNFDDPFSVAKHVKVTRVHPHIVCLDLHRGSLKTLARYLAQESGIPDVQVAVELQKLISGNVNEAQYRLAVVPHPDAQNVGGRPKSKSGKVSDNETAIVERFNAFLVVDRKAYLAREHTAFELGISESKVDRARQKAARSPEAEQAIKQVAKRREDALAHKSASSSKRKPKKRVTKPAQVS